MNIKRRIERTITVTPREIYTAIAAQFDLPANPQEVSIKDNCDLSLGSIVVTAVEYIDQELGE